MAGRAVYDVTLPLREGMLSYPGDPSFRKTRYKAIEKGNSANVSEYTIGSHTGTHLDVPRHFFKKGKTLDAVPLERFLGSVQVVALPRTVLVIQPDDVARFCPLKAENVFFKTKNSSSKYIGSTVFKKDYTSLGLEAARLLKKEGVGLVGIDYLSIEAYGSKPHRVHAFLLQNNIFIVEGLDLRAVPEGVYSLFCLPLRIAQADGGLLRVVLRSG